jgi:hypothetical protein
VNCPLCGTRRARRGCPALNQQICPICCGTKRLVQIRCPSDCPWLVSAREHPPAVVVRQQQRDVDVLIGVMREFTERQSQLFFLVSTFLVRYEAPELQAIIDQDVADAVSALASTMETASRGVIYEHRPASLPAERLAAAMKLVLAEAGQGLGSAFERDAAAVLRRVAKAVSDLRVSVPGERRPLLDLLARVVSEMPGRGAADGDQTAPPSPSGLIVP